MDPNTSTVWFPCELPPSKASRDLSSAHRYGRIRHIWPASAPAASMVPGPVLRTMLQELRDFKPGSDFVSHNGGDPMGLALIFLALRELGHREVQFLRYDREIGQDGRRSGRGFYVPVVVSTTFQR